MANDVILWFRRDLRVADNPALIAAVSDAEHRRASVLAVFVLDPVLGTTSGPNRLAMLYRCLRSLERSGVPLVLRHGDPVAELSHLCHESGADTVYATDDFAPYGRSRDRNVGAALQIDGRSLELIDSPYVVAPGTVLKGDGTSYRVFTPFSRAWSALSGGVAPERPVETSDVPWFTGVDGEPVPSDPPGASANLPAAGEPAAAERLDRFVRNNLRAYDERRNHPAADATSRISPDLKYGVLHPRTVLDRVRDDTSDGARVFRSEICWREFYADVLWHTPSSARTNWNGSMDAMRVDGGRVAEQRFARWCAGETGYPIVDAGMRQLLAEGWMHNRVRMIVASFLVKDLHLDWRLGARHFMRYLIDGDIASNQHGWQWTAGTGTDAAPYFRVFNPVSQGKKFDPGGEYVRRWVPELGHLPGASAHEPWDAAPAGLFGPAGDAAVPEAVSGVRSSSPAARYPERVVDHAAEREEALARYAACRVR